MRAHGWVRDLPANSVIFDERDDDFFEAYRFILPGYNVRPIEISGAIGLEQLKKLPTMTAERRKNWALFQKLFAGDDRFIIQRENGKSSAFSLHDRPQSRGRTVAPAHFRAAQESRYRLSHHHRRLFPRHDVDQALRLRMRDGLPNANLAHDHGFFVGNHPFDLTPQIERLREVLDIAAR